MKLRGPLGYFSPIICPPKHVIYAFIFIFVFECECDPSQKKWTNSDEISVFDRG